MSHKNDWEYADTNGKRYIIEDLYFYGSVRENGVHVGYCTSSGGHHLCRCHKCKCTACPTFVGDIFTRRWPVYCVKYFDN